MADDVFYDDGSVRLDSHGLTLRRYYFPTGKSKSLGYDQIQAIHTHPLTWLSGRERGWGTAHPGYWLPLDLGRFRKRVLVVLDVGRRVSPAFTPDDPDTVVELVRQRLAH
jgi:hypothetical protein